MNHITKSGKAKCNYYENGRRCSRVARVEVFDFNTHRLRMCCEEHAQKLVDEGKARFMDDAPKGYAAKSSFVFGIGNTTEYRRID